MREAARAAGRSLEQHIRAEIENRIMSGVWNPGDRVPAEHELMIEFGCSRMTVNRALSVLAEAGFVERRRRAGTIVARPRTHMAAIAIPDIGAQIAARGGRYRLDTQAVRRLAASDAPETARMPDDGALLSILCCHLSDDRPFAIEQRLINLAAVPQAADMDFTVTPPGTWLLAHVPWTEADYRIGAVSAGGNAGLLGVDVAAACLSFERWTWRAGETITYVRQIFPGEGFALTAG